MTLDLNDSSADVSGTTLLSDDTPGVAPGNGSESTAFSQVIDVLLSYEHGDGLMKVRTGEPNLNRIFGALLRRRLRSS